MRLVSPPPPPVGPPVDWKEVEADLGFQFPADYRALVTAYGPGVFDDFLWVLHPTTNNPNLQLATQLSVRRQALAASRASGDPHPTRLIPWAFTDNGDVCYWRTPSTLDKVDDWLITVNESRWTSWAEFDMTSVEWLVAVLTGRLRLTVFPNDFPSQTPTFRRA